MPRGDGKGPEGKGRPGKGRGPCGQKGSGSGNRQGQCQRLGIKRQNGQKGGKPSNSRSSEDQS